MQLGKDDGVNVSSVAMSSSEGKARCGLEGLGSGR
jgi:hypothetical protein